VNKIGTGKPFLAIRIVAKKLPIMKKNKPMYSSNNETFRFPKYLPALVTAPVTCVVKIPMMIIDSEFVKPARKPKMFAYAFFLSKSFTQQYSGSTSSIIGPASHGFKFNSILKVLRGLVNSALRWLPETVMPAFEIKFQPKPS